MNLKRFNFLFFCFKNELNYFKNGRVNFYEQLTSHWKRSKKWCSNDLRCLKYQFYLKLRVKKAACFKCSGNKCNATISLNTCIVRTKSKYFAQLLTIHRSSFKAIWDNCKKQVQWRYKKESPNLVQQNHSATQQPQLETATRCEKMLK